MPSAKNGPVAKTEMVIRRPVDEVFKAIIDPAVTTKFWFSKSSGKLEAGKRVRWDWEMYGVGTDVDVKEIEPNKRILIEWDSYEGRTPVEWEFEARPDNTTKVTVLNYGFRARTSSVRRSNLRRDFRTCWPGSRLGWSTISRSS